MGLIQEMLSGNQRALSKLITLVENDSQARTTINKETYEKTGNAQIIGFTGPPGVGKSTLVNQVTTELLQRDKKVGVIAIDPSSPFSKGAVLGDRIRMLGHEDNKNLFIRSLASRGRLGGLSRAVNDVVNLMDAYGMDIILIETVGIGQSEYDIAKLAHTTVIVLSPGYGDDIQSMKAGILEVGDLFVVNKSDMEGKRHVLVDLRGMIELNYHGRKWKPTTIPTTATEGKGTVELVDQLLKHYEYVIENDEWSKLEKQRVEKELEDHLLDWVQNTLLEEFQSSEEGIKDIDDIIQRKTNPALAIERYINNLIMNEK